ncbi:hypothetical protein ROHU_013910 [Labeo rohita]|uniref:Interferon-induced 44-like protein n=1 Tax=Labeo rohita TaxID=84645 RepID=A0A498P341_LABRO|nr:hypothetical protein ROHU_013910 [Labeo rohita]
MLWSRKTLSVFYNRSKEDIVYLDATGSVIQKSAQSPPYYVYELVDSTRHYKLGMHVFGLLACCSTLKEMDEVVYSSAVVFCSPCSGPDVPKHYNNLRLLMQQRGSFELNEKDITAEDYKHDFGTTPLMSHFQATISNAVLDLNGPSNIYYSPEFISALAKYFLPYATLWSGDLGRHGKSPVYQNLSKFYKKVRQSKKQNFTQDNHTQGIMEKSQWDLKQIRFQRKRLKRLDDFVQIYQKMHGALLVEYADVERCRKKKWKCGREVGSAEDFVSPLVLDLSLKKTREDSPQPHLTDEQTEVFMQTQIIECLLHHTVNHLHLDKNIYIMNHFVAGVILSRRQSLSKVNFDEYKAIVSFINVENVHWKFLYINAAESSVYLVDPLDNSAEQAESDLAANKFREKERLENDLKNFKLCKENFKFVRILLIGQVGAGKSSFINSVKSVFLGYMATDALFNVTMNNQKSFTKAFTTYEITSGEYALPFVLTDTMSLEPYESQGIHPDDIAKALEGFIKEGYKFNPASAVSCKDDGYRSNPTIREQALCVVYVMPADKISFMQHELIEKFKNIRQKVSDLEFSMIP